MSDERLFSWSLLSDHDPSASPCCPLIYSQIAASVFRKQIPTHFIYALLTKCYRYFVLILNIVKLI